MTSASQLETVEKEIDDVKAEILETKDALAAAQHDADVHFLRKQLEQLRKKEEQLRKKEEQLREKENILLQGQASGEHCLPWYQPQRHTAFALSQGSVFTVFLT